jgi:hypothetical protein
MKQEKKITGGIKTYKQEDLFGCALLLLLEVRPQTNIYRQIMLTRKEIYAINTFIDGLLDNQDKNVDTFFAKRGTGITFNLDDQHIQEHYTKQEFKKYGVKKNNKEKNEKDEEDETPDGEDFES